MLDNKKSLSLTTVIAFGVPLAWLLAASIPEVVQDRIFPFDSALIAANGGLFQQLFSDIGNFVRAPVDWLWSYYDQYPALSVRRHPPLFGFVSGIIYSVIGVSTSAAKLTVMLFGCVFAAGIFCIARRMLNDDLQAGIATLLVVATQQITIHFYSVWLDIPSLAFAAWLIYFYVARLDGDQSMRNSLMLAIFAVLTLYTYQPTLVLLAGVFVHLLAREWRTLLKDKYLLISAVVLVVAMLPLAAFTFVVAKDNLIITTGEIPSAWKEFDSPTYADWMVRDKLSFAYWAYYGKVVAQTYPVQVAGLLLWTLLRAVRRPSSAETALFVCVVVTYLAFSWLVVKGHRYTLYMMIPASILTVAAVRDLAARMQARWRLPGAAPVAVLLLLTGLQGLLVKPYSPYVYLSGMDVPVSRILDDDAAARIFYSGRNDAAFVLYTRALDDAGTASVARASVQVEKPEDLASYLDQNDIDFVVLEVDNPGYDTLEVIDEFRARILDYMSAGAPFSEPENYRLPFGISETLGYVSINVYKRSSETGAVQH